MVRQKFANGVFGCVIMSKWALYFWKRTLYFFTVSASCCFVQTQFKSGEGGELIFVRLYGMSIFSYWNVCAFTCM